MVFILGQRCSLRCKVCGNFTPLLPQVDYDFESIWSDLAKVSKISRIERLQIQGGEAFISTSFVEFLHRLKSLSSIGAVQIATNGMHLLKSDQIEAIKELNASVRIYDYGPESVSLQ